VPLIRNILCPVDFSPTADHAADYAVALAEQLGASVCFFHAWEIPVYAMPEGALAFGVDVTARVDEAMQKQLDAVVARYANRKLVLRGRVASGAPAFEICRYAVELQADLVVIGTHGRTGLAHVLIGSVAERVVRTSPVPVLAVPRPKD
jgi:universal stress protein A